MDAHDGSTAHVEWRYRNPEFALRLDVIKQGFIAWQVKAVTCSRLMFSSSSLSMGFADAELLEQLENLADPCRSARIRLFQDDHARSTRLHNFWLRAG